MNCPVDSRITGNIGVGGRLEKLENLFGFKMFQYLMHEVLILRLIHFMDKRLYKGLAKKKPPLTK